MFERYTEKARRSILFARHEARTFASPEIRSELLLLAILREDEGLSIRLFGSASVVASIREQIKAKTPLGEPLKASVDLPMSLESKRALAYGAEEAERLNHKHIGTEHLILGLLREKNSLASQLLEERGVTLEKLREDFTRPGEEPPGKSVFERVRGAATETQRSGTVEETGRDLTAAAREGELPPLIGREQELERMIQVLMRRTRKNPVQGGVGKTAIVYGLARRIADGQVPAFLADRQVLAIDASVLLTPGREDFESHADAILFVDGLFDLAAAGRGWPVLEATRVLGPLLARSGFQCIATGTPSAFRQTAQKAVSLALHFEIVPVLPPSEEDALRILRGVKQEYERHHHVVISDGAIEAAVRASARFLRHRCLPDRAIDLLDDASARVSLGQPLVRADNTVSARDIAEAAAARAGAPLDAVERAIAETVPEDPDRIARELIALIPQGREWLEPLADYLAGCSAGEAEELAAAIRNVKGSPSH